MKTVLSSSSKGNTRGVVRAKGATSQKNATEGLQKLFFDGLKDAYYTEKAIMKAIPKMIKKSSSEELATALNEHMSVTQEQISRLEEVFNTVGKRAQTRKCEAIEGLIKEGVEIMGSADEGVVRDAGIIAAAQKIEHYEIATYGTLSAFARALGEDEALSLLEETLSEEKDADEKLTEIAESSINVQAAGENGDDTVNENGEENGEVRTVAKAKKGKSS